MNATGGFQRTRLVYVNGEDGCGADVRQRLVGIDGGRSSLPVSASSNVLRTTVAERENLGRWARDSSDGHRLAKAVLHGTFLYFWSCRVTGRSMYRGPVIIAASLATNTTQIVYRRRHSFIHCVGSSFTLGDET